MNKWYSSVGWASGADPCLPWAKRRSSLAVSYPSDPSHVTWQETSRVSLPRYASAGTTIKYIGNDEIQQSAFTNISEHAAEAGIISHAQKHRACKTKAFSMVGFEPLHRSKDVWDF